MQRNVVEHEEGVGGEKVRIQTDRLSARLNTLFILTNSRIDCPRQGILRFVGARIGLYPKLAGLFGLFHVASDCLIKASRDEIPLRLTGSVAQFVCLSSVIGSDAGFSNIHIREAQPCESESKIRV